MFGIAILARVNAQKHRVGVRDRKVHADITTGLSEVVRHFGGEISKLVGGSGTVQGVEVSGDGAAESGLRRVRRHRGVRGLRVRGRSATGKRVTSDGEYDEEREGKPTHAPTLR